MTTLCTICGLTKDTLTTRGVSWSNHVEREHNIWSYVTFFYYLQEHDGRFSAVENEVCFNSEVRISEWACIPGFQFNSNVIVRLITLVQLEVEY